MRVKRGSRNARWISGVGFVTVAIRWLVLCLTWTRTVVTLVAIAASALVGIGNLWLAIR